tara:strand:- start:717 stop:1019 length:303 start_codon:yes stop_codon:yes gene_type:complete
MANDGISPATKQDIQILMQYIHDAFEDMEKRFNNLRKEVKEQMKEHHKKCKVQHIETRRHFDVVAENIHHDLAKGALSDKVEQNSDRIERIEDHIGLVSA